ncbi:Uncharacterized protein dnl_49340 [Desulfonema limicola]|uniref:Dicarboxylate transport domain-containing protein n=1 Tax=Desulfonema limicola TaxID=45656 RepID=A0A975GIG3_9BACT|nr:YdbH domain-containing protein [Desulfonema limicola]QTA82557.1 Uncharacterized protein dnl_49340 [Desulfonema limicola]
MSIKKKKILFKIIFFCFLMICCIPIVLYFSIPFFLNSSLFSQNLQKYLPLNLSWDVRRLSLTGFDINSLLAGSENKKTLSIKSLNLDYSPAQIFNKHIQKISFSGIELYCGLKQGEFYFQGFDLNEFLKQIDSNKTPSASKQISLPFSFEKLEIHNAVIVFNWENQSFRIPFNLEVILENNHLLKGILKVYPRNQEISAIFCLDIFNKKIDLDIKGSSIKIERFADITGFIQGLYLSGNLDIAGDLEIQIEPFNLISACAALSFQNKGSFYHDFKLKKYLNPDKQFNLDIQYLNDNKWKLSADSLFLEHPFKISMDQVNAWFNQDAEKLECSGNIQIGIKGSGLDFIPYFQTINPLILKQEFSAEILKNGQWDFKLKTMPGVNPFKPPVVKLDKAEFVINPPEIEINASGKSRMEKAVFKINTDKAELKSGDIFINIPYLSVSGKTAYDKKDNLYCNGDLNIKADIQDLKSKTHIKDIKAGFPFQWPWKKNNKKGELSALSIIWNKINFGDLKGFIYQDDTGVIFDGKHLSQIIPGFKINIKADSNLVNQEKHAQIKFSSIYKKTKPFNLGTIHKTAKGIEFDGLLKLNGVFNLDKTGVKAEMDAGLDNTNIRIKEKDMAFENIDLNFSISDLFKMRSLPKQPLGIEKISIGSININNAYFEFQTESDRSVLIEKGFFKWCKGNINAQALRIIPGLNNYDMILYCDRLNLAELFMQLGVAKAEGQGNVSGRIPVVFNNGNLSFQDGFLFSTPGQGGTIHLTGAEILTQGIPKHTRQYNQIDLAREALKDYDYQWVKLLMNTEGENLMLKINFDGKPSSPLPFIYDQDFGGFVRIESGKQLSDFQGIRLNVNMGIPLNEILKNKGILDYFNK